MNHRVAPFSRIVARNRDMESADEARDFWCYLFIMKKVAKLIYR